MATKKDVNFQFGGRVVTPKGLLNFPKLFSPDTGGQYSDNNYKCDLLFNSAQKDSLKPLVAEVKALAERVWGPGVKFTSPFKNGDSKDIAKYPEYQGVMYIQAKSKFRPSVVGNNVLPLSEEDIYSGCWARISVTPMSYVARGEKGITFKLGNVQKVADGEPLGRNSYAASADFGEPNAPTQGAGVVESSDSQDFADEDIPF